MKKIDEALNFWNITPEKIDQNCGTIWIKNKNDGKTYALTPNECIYDLDVENEM